MSQQNWTAKGINITIPKHQSQFPQWYNSFRAVIYHIPTALYQTASSGCCWSTTGGEHGVISPSCCIFFLYRHVFTVPGILCVQSDYGHFKQKTGAKQTQVLENSLQNTTDGITAAKTTHSLKQWWFKGTSFSGTRTRDINWFPKLLVKALSSHPNHVK